MKVEHTIGQRVNVNFCVKLQKSPRGTLEMLENSLWRVPRPKKPQMLKSKIKTMLICSFDIRGIIHFKFVSKGTTVNHTFYMEVLKRLIVAVRRK
jgi:hypothetical protein